MHTFREFLGEHILSIGFNPDHEKHREAHRQQIHDLLHHSYKKIGGYGGLGSGSKAESDEIHKDISNSSIKATKRGDKITSVQLYKKQHGRKSIATGTDGSEQGKKDWVKLKDEDNKLMRAWGEVSGAVEKIQRNLGYPEISSDHTKKLLNKDVEHIKGTNRYIRKIGGHHHEKIMMGHTKTD